MGTPDVTAMQGAAVNREFAGYHDSFRTVEDVGSTVTPSHRAVGKFRGSRARCSARNDKS
jgi:hypothetical protein